VPKIKPRFFFTRRFSLHTVSILIFKSSLNWHHPHAAKTLWPFANDLFMHNSFILQQYVCYIRILYMFRAAPCSSSGGKILLLLVQPLVSSLSVNSRTVCRLRALNMHTVRLFTESDDTRGCSNKICPPEDEQGAARNMLRIVM